MSIKNVIRDMGQYADPDIASKSFMGKPGYHVLSSPLSTRVVHSSLQHSGLGNWKEPRLRVVAEGSIEAMLAAQRLLSSEGRKHL